MTSDKENSAMESGVEQRLLENTAAKFLRQRFDQGSTGTESESELERWLQADETHREAFRKVQCAWEIMDDLAVEPGVELARRAALADAQRRVWDRRPHWRRYAVAVAIMLALPLLYIAIGELRQSQFQMEEVANTRTYATGIGETRIIRLFDNSRVSLDAQTRVAVSYTTESRVVQLLAGQAHFDVAGDPVRPFHVEVGDQTIVALGTAFNVELMEQRILITLMEGQVVVSDTAQAVLDKGLSAERENSSHKVHELNPGEQLIISRHGTTLLRKGVDLKKVVAWRQGKLIFDGEDLSTAIARMNRHSHIRIVLQSEGFGGDALQNKDALNNEFTISGIFDAGDTTAFVEAVEYYFPLKAERIRHDTIALQSALRKKSKK